MLALLFPFIKSLLGDGIIQSFLNHKKDLAASANGAEKVRLDAEVSMAAYELKRREAQKELQIAELPYSEMRRAKALLMWSVAIYWFARFMVETLGLGDYGVVINELSPTMQAVSLTVLGYMFIDGTIKRVTGK